VSERKFLFFGKFIGFDAVLRQDWLTSHKVILNMGTGKITIATDVRKHVLNSITTRGAQEMYNRTPRPGPVLPIFWSTKLE
jgi:hypothetical protein